jgi:small subunit ribosomal protein S16
MAVSVRLRRMGAKNDACYRVVAADSRSPRDGRFLEILGWYDPTRKGETCSLNMERIDYWKSRGAQLSKTVASLARRTRRAVEV